MTTPTNGPWNLRPMTRSPHLLGMLCCLLLGAPSAASAAAAPSNLHGRVTDTAGQGISGARVKATGARCGGGGEIEGFTGPNGDYALTVSTSPVYVYACQNCSDWNTGDSRIVWWTGAGGAHDCSHAEAIPVAAQGATGIDLVLTPPTYPSVVAVQPADGAAGVPVDQPIMVQFDRSMDPNCRVQLEDWFNGPERVGQSTWSQRVYPSDTLTFVPDGPPLRYSMAYELTFDCRDTGGAPVGGYYREVSVLFSTAGAPGENSAPRVTSTAPYAGQVGGAASPIRIQFDKPIDPATVNAQSVVLTGPGAPSYKLEPEGFGLKIFPRGLQTQAQYQVTLTTAVADAEGHALAAPYSFGFNTGAGDATAPTVVQTRPANQAPGLEWEPISINFSENMDPDSIGAATVKVFDETAGGAQIGSHIDKRWVDGDGERAKIEIDRAFEEGGRWQSGHTYRVELDATISDLAGNPLGSDQVFRFTVVNSYPGSPDAPPSMMGEGDSRANREPDGRVTVELVVSASSTTGGTLDVDVEDLTQAGRRWDNLQPDGENNYVYTTPDGGDEGLVPGPHHLRITVTELSNGQSRTLLWTIYVFNAVPALTGGPADGATGVSVQPSFGFATNGMTGAAAYWLVIMEETSGDMVYQGVAFPDAGNDHSVQVPPSQALKPGTAYRWAVGAFDSIGWEVGMAGSEMRSFVTGSRAFCWECLPNRGGWRAMLQ